MNTTPKARKEDYTSRTKEASGSSLGTNTDSGYASRSSHSTAPSTEPSIKVFHSAQEHQKADDSKSSSTSRNTYVETLDSLEEKHEHYEPDYFQQEHQLFNDSTPSDPTQFARLFPSRRTFIIKHDDSVADGHMNLRMDTVYDRPGRRSKKLTLFYLRMYELETRHFAIRRYGRDCGREVANTSRKFTKPAAARPGLPRTVSKAFQSFRGKQDMAMGIKRQDSGLSSDDEDENVNHDGPQATNTCTLDFSNYARIELNRKGQKASKKYDFEYWGKAYTWKRQVRRDGLTDTTTLTMFDSNSTPIATITPLECDSVSIDDRARGRFVPASELHFCLPERDIRKQSFVDLADVVVTTGLMALVDDCIKRRDAKKAKAVAFSLPMPSRQQTKVHFEYVGAKKIVDELFKRSPSRPATPTKTPSTPTRMGMGRTQTTSANATPTRMKPMRAWTSPPTVHQEAHRSPVCAQ